MPPPSFSGSANHAYGLQLSKTCVQNILSPTKLDLTSFVRPRKHRDKSEALRLESYLYAPPSVQERIIFGVRSYKNREKVMEIEKYLKDIKERVP
jgi:hypothetical protein